MQYQNMYNSNEKTVKLYDKQYICIFKGLKIESFVITIDFTKYLLIE